MKKIIIIISLLVLLSATVQASTFNKMVERTIFYNHKFVENDSRLDSWDKITRSEAYNRVDSIIFWSNYYNYMYDIDPDKVSLIMYSLIEYETAFVNWKSLDNGMSFGVISMRWDTAKIYAKKTGVSMDNISNDTRKQIRLAVYYFYDKLQKYGDTNKAILSYNRGSASGGRIYHEYVFKVLGRYNYLEKEWK